MSEKGGKDNSDDYVYVKSENGQDKLDRNGHLIVDHDLHNHDGELPDGIAEAFIEWAKGEGLSFWENEEDGLRTDRRQAWRDFISNNRQRRIYVDSDIDISRLGDEMNDMEVELKK